MQLIFVKYREFYVDSGDVYDIGYGIYDLENEEFIDRLSVDELEKDYSSIMPHIVNSFTIDEWSTAEIEDEDGNYVDTDVGIEIDVYAQNKLKSTFLGLGDSKLTKHFKTISVSIPSELRQLIVFTLNVLGLSPIIETPYISSNSQLRELNNVLLEFNFPRLNPREQNLSRLMRELERRITDDR